MANWTYSVTKINSLSKTSNGSVVIRMGAHKMPLVHVDRFNLLLPLVKEETNGPTTLVVSCTRKTPKSEWILDVFNDGQRLRKEARAKYGLENLSFSSVLSLAKTINPRISVNISED